VAKKPRTPPPPRRVQAPKQRQAPRRGLDQQRQRLVLYGVAAAGIVGLAIVLVVIVGGGGSSATAGDPDAIAATMKAGGCTLSTSQASPSNQHIAGAGQAVTYATYPAVSGRHFGTPAIYDNYSQEVDPRAAVHNMEHGAVVIWVGPDITQSERQQISDFYFKSPNGILVTPIRNTAQGVKYPKHAAPDSRVYLTAWTVEIEDGNAVGGTNVIATCTRFDEPAFRAFRDEFRGKGPERFPLSSQAPGT
jgi:hypothetical protein